MKRLIFILLISLCWTPYLRASDILIVVNNENPIVSLSESQVIDIYMGRNQNFPNNMAAFPLDQQPTSQIRSLFYRKLINKSVAQMNAYWAKLLFTGRASPPRVMHNSEAVKKAIQSNTGAIGYINSDQLDDTVKVVGYAD